LEDEQLVACGAVLQLQLRFHADRLFTFGPSVRVRAHGDLCRSSRARRQQLTARSAGDPYAVAARFERDCEGAAFAVGEQLLRDDVRRDLWSADAELRMVEVADGAARSKRQFH